MASRKKKMQDIASDFPMPDVPVKQGQVKKLCRRVLALLSENHRTGTPVQLVEFLKQSACLSQAEASAALRSMVADSMLTETQPGSGLWGVSLRCAWFESTVQGRRSGEYAVENPETGETYELYGTRKCPVLPGDRILVSPMPTSYEYPNDTAQVEKVLERGRKQWVCRTVSQVRIPRLEGAHFWVQPVDPFAPTRILVSGEAKSYREKAFVVELSDSPVQVCDGTFALGGDVIEVLGDMDDPSVEITIAVRRFDLPRTFAPEVLAQAQALPDVVDKKDYKGRIDLTDIGFVTIDGEDARDFDDAVWAMPHKDGWRLLVAIADVSHYVTPETPLDCEAQQRATSVYFPRCVIPMLPEKLSNGLCSLNPGVDRLTVVCDMIVSAQGTVSAYQFYRAVIHSHARLTYTAVYAALCGDSSDAVARGANPEDIQVLYALFQVFRDAREKRGAIDFETAETQIVCDESGKVQSIRKRDHNDAHRIIEECMLAANTCAADFISRQSLSGLYRVHGAPSPDRLETLRAELAFFGVTLEGDAKPGSKDFDKALSAVPEGPRREVVQLAMLRTMQQAVYSPVNIGHYGLNYPAYTHFTSPIRRYPDLLVHRTICAALAKKKYSPKFVAETGWLRLSRSARNVEKTLEEIRAHALVPEKSDFPVWNKLGLVCSAAERRADDASRDVTSWLKCVYVESLPSKTYQGIVTGVNRAGLYVTLTDMFVEGFVHVSNIGHDYYYFDEQTQSFAGESSGDVYGLGDRVCVRIESVDVDTRSIDFALDREPRCSRKSSGARRKISRRKKLV